MKKIFLFIALIIIGIQSNIYGQNRNIEYYYYKNLTGYYIYTPVTGSMSTLASGIFVTNSNTRIKTDKADTLGSKKTPLNYTWVQRYSYNLDDLSDSTQVSDSVAGSSRYFDVSMFPIGSQISYRHSIVERKANGINYYKTDVSKTYTVKEIEGHPLYSADGFPLFDSEGVLLFPADE